MEKSKCDGCAHGYSSNSETCVTCNKNPSYTDNYAKQPNLLQNLFMGAPVLVRDRPQHPWQRRYYSHNDRCFIEGKTKWSMENNETTPWNFMALPSVIQSPRNTWLAAPWHDRCPEGVEDLMVTIWPDVPPTPLLSQKLGKSWDWSTISRFMILSYEDVLTEQEV